MSRRNGNNIKLTETEIKELKTINIKLRNKINRIKREHNVDIKKQGVELKTNFANKKEYTDYLKRTKDVLKRSSFAHTKLPSGESVNTETLNTLKSRINEINEQYRNRQKDIVKSARKLFGEEIAFNIERDLEILNKKERTRLTSGNFDDLKELDVDKIVGRIQNQEDLELVTEQLFENDFYDLNKRDILYRENYVKAMYNTHGENDKTKELEKLVRELDINAFMVSYYNPYSNTQLQDFYDENQADDYIDYLISYFRRLSDMSSNDKWAIM